MSYASKSYCFTLNNYKDDEISRIEAFISSCCTYGLFGKEVGDSGTPHLQGFFILKERKRLQFLKDGCSDRAHYEKSKGTAQQNRAYCSKDGIAFEFGRCPGKLPQKSRDEIAREFVQAMATGCSAGLTSFAEDNPGVFYFSGHNLLRNYLRSRPAIDRGSITVNWYFGRPGVGKSRRAHAELPNAYIKEPRTKWWTGYGLERDCIIDDFGPGGIDINHLLRWFDRYKCYVETKGDMVPLYVCNFIVTSNFHPSQVYVDPKDGGTHPQMEALLRRIVITEM